MALYLQIDSLAKSYSERLLFADVTFPISEGDKIGIVAKNGTGKSTLLRIIAGVEAPDRGCVTHAADISIGFLEQTPEFPEGASVIEACMAGQKHISDVIVQYENALNTGDDEALSRATDAMDAAGAWDYEKRLSQMLSALNIDAPASTPMAVLSGGQRKRVALVALLISQPDLIILDEPTNHLDINAIEWLEAYLTRQRITLLMVTHDRYFLDRVCNRIIEIDRAQIYTYEGNFDYYLRRRKERIEAMSAELDRVRNTLRREQEWMNRQPQARAGKARYRIDQYYDLKERSRINLEERNIELRGESSYIGSKIFEAHNVCKRFDDKIILDDFSYMFARYEKLGIIGANGVGKSTFIKMLQGLEPSDSGRWDVGTTVRFGYYSQQGIEFDSSKKVIDAVSEIADDIDYAGRRLSPMQFLQQFLFSVPDQQKYIHTLSGGEKARLHLATVLMRQPNFLILDEPTNDLDIVTLGILEEYLANFKGCLIVISHDRYFLDNIVDHLFVLEGNGVVRDFPGNYTDYRQYCEQRAALAADAANNTAKATAKATKTRTERAPRLTWAERREFEALEAEIEALSKEKSDLEQLFNSGSEIIDIEEKSRRYTVLSDLLDEKEMRWLELSEKA